MRSPELIGRRTDERELTFLRDNQQQVLVGQKHKLTVAVASALPLALAVLEVDRRENAAVEAEGMPFVHDEVVEGGLQPVRCPALFHAPSAFSVRDRDADRADPTGAGVHGANEDVALGGESRLHDVASGTRVLPELRAVGGRDAGRPASAQHQNLFDSIDRHQMW